MTDRFDLRSARVNAGLTQRQLAKRVGVGRETIRRLEAGESATPANAKKVADHFGVQAMDLLPPRDVERKAAA